MKQVFAVLTVLASSATIVPAAVDFAHEVVPVLREHCVECHGGSKSKGGFSLNTRALVLEAEVVEVGKPGESILVELLHAEDPDERMPPVKKRKERLPAETIAILERWIAEGLPWEPGFTFAEDRYEPPLKPRRPELPRGAAGANPIDLIVGDYLRESGVAPLEPLDDRSFARRLFLDVLGVPPAPGELEAFAASDDPEKRPGLVAEVLGRDGEYAAHWMTFWNDLLRNTWSGTGYIDGGRKQLTEWLYRSLLENKPYDQFVRELIAPTTESEGFIRGIKWRGNVNASQTRKIQFSQNISQVFLGINMKCASCHDSFIDGWTLEQAYSLAAIYSEEPLELHRCDKPTGKIARAAWIFPELGDIDPRKPQPERLAQLAALMTHPENGRTQRTIVNRVWRQMMGRGIVHPVDAMGTRPWSEDLLDFLATYLADNQYDLKKLIALVANSGAYQSRGERVGEVVDEYVFRGPVMKRMTAEQFLDSVRTVTGAWPEPDGKAFKRDGRGQGGQLVAVTSAHGMEKWDGRPLRAVFTPLDSLQSFLGRPNREQVVTGRPDLVTTLEAITLANGAPLAEILDRGAERLVSEIGTDQLVGAVYRRALSRPPAPQEAAVARGLLGDPVEREGVADFLWAVFMLPEFQYVN